MRRPPGASVRAGTASAPPRRHRHKTRGNDYGRPELSENEQAPQAGLQPGQGHHLAAGARGRRLQKAGAVPVGAGQGAGAVRRGPGDHLQKRRLEDPPVLPGDGLGQHGPGPMGPGPAVLPVPDGVQPVHGELRHGLPFQAEHAGRDRDLQGGPQDHLRRQQLPDPAVRRADAVLHTGLHLHLACEHQAEQDQPADPRLRSPAEEHEGRPAVPGGQPVPQDAAGPAHAGRVRVHDTASARCCSGRWCGPSSPRS